MNRHNTCLDWDEDAVKFSASLSTDTDVVSSSMKIELPPPFKGDGTKSFATWSKQFEAAVRAHTRVGAGLLSAVERLSMKVDKLQTQLRDIKDNNCKAGYDRQDMYSSRRRDQRSPSPYRGRRGGCRCDCGEYGCRSAAPDFSVRGRSPQHGGSFLGQERSDAGTPTAGPWSPRDTEGPYKRGVRFLSPGRRSPSPAQARRDQENSQ